MFEELYKNANDRIDTKEPYERLMKKLQKSPKKISVVRRVEYAAALAACISLAFVGIKNIDLGTQNPVIPEKYTVSTVIQTQEEQEIPPITKIQPQENKTNKRDIKSKNINKQPERKAAEKPESEQVNTEKVHQQTVYEDVPAVLDKKPTDNIKVNEAEDIGVSPAMMNETKSRTITEYVTMSDEEYIEYIGMDIAKQAVLPEGMENITESGAVLVSDGEKYIEDKKTYNFAGNEKYAAVTTSRDTKSVDAKFNDERYEKSTISGKDVVISGKDNIYEAQLSQNSVAIDVTVENFSQDELKILINSLLK